MGAFQSVPDDVLTGMMAECVVGIPYHKPNYKEKMLVLRTTCKDGRDLVRRILADKNRFPSMSLFFSSEQANSATVATEPREMRVSAQHVEAVGRVFGAGCTHLYASGRSPERIAALEVFVVSRTRRLESLNLDNAAVSVEVLLRMCRAVPRLSKLRCPRFMETSDDTIRAISEICPLLREAYFSRLGRDSGEYSPVETWARLFPQLQEFNLHGGRWVGYQPSRIEAIHECALVSKAHDLHLDACHITAEVIEAIVGTPLGDRMEYLGFSDYFPQDETNIEPAAFLAAARGFPKLTDIHIPKGSTMGGPGFYVDLSRAAPVLTTLEIFDVGTTDACVAAACRHIRLTHLVLSGCLDLTSSVVESITGGQAAGTLTSLTIKHCAQGPFNPLRAVDVLRLVTGCPNIDSFSWYCSRDHHEYTKLDEGPCKAIVELFAARVEGKDYSRVYCYAGDWNEIDYEDDPDCIFE